MLQKNLEPVPSGAYLVSLRRTLRRALTSGVAGRKRMVVRFTWYRVTQFLTVAFIAGGVALLTFLEQVRSRGKPDPENKYLPGHGGFSPA